MKELFNNYNDLMNASLEKGYGTRYQYDNGDLIIIDNWQAGGVGFRWKDDIPMQN